MDYFEYRRYTFDFTITHFITIFVGVSSSPFFLPDSFHPSFIEEYTDGLLIALQKQYGGIHPILCGEM
jgi:hypothetical protein